MKQKERIEIPIGGIFIRNGVKYKVIKDYKSDCKSCAFWNIDCSEFPPCDKENRSDKENVHFEKLTKKHK